MASKVAVEAKPKGGVREEIRTRLEELRADDPSLKNVNRLYRAAQVAGVDLTRREVEEFLSPVGEKQVF
jgi:hypothetical protein